MPSNFPTSFDSDSNLYLVHDALRIRLIEDYNPGDTIIYVADDPIFSNFPFNGIITLTEQVNDLDLRATSFEYTGIGIDSVTGDNVFTGLVLLPGFTDVVKPKLITDVTINVTAPHHNNLKDALISIQDTVGSQGDVASSPLQGTMVARTNYLRSIALLPKAWFTSDHNIGIVPMKINFQDYSTGQPTTWVWNFGDGDMQTLTTNGNASKVYLTPGIYDVSLTVSNAFGSNTITMPGFVVARVIAPDPATITFTPTASQIYAGGILRSEINQLIEAMVVTNGQQAMDPIVDYVWNFDDDLQHANSETTVASYSIGGFYDVKLKTETELGAYRITDFPDVVNIVEKFNIWHFIFDSLAPTDATTKTLYVYEFGLLSETYKSAAVSSAISVTRNAGFLTGVPNESQQYAEFRRNNGFAPRSLTPSGSSGNAVLFWSEGSATPVTQLIRFRELNGFNNLWITPTLGNGFDYIDRQWNWLALSSTSNTYILLGAPGPAPSINSPTNQTFKSIGLSTYSITDIPFTSTNYQNSATELMNNVGDGTAGDFSVYRGTWNNSNGYFVRNDGTGTFFRLKSFYSTLGNLTNQLQGVIKLTDMPGSTKFEGQMVSLTQGVYFFNNTGEVTVYNPVNNTWGVGGPGINSPTFTSLQDTTVDGYSNQANTLVITSDQSTNAYLFYDYSTRAQVKFNETNLTFTTLPVRPSGEQFLAGLY